MSDIVHCCDKIPHAIKKEGFILNPNFRGYIPWSFGLMAMDHSEVKHWVNLSFSPHGSWQEERKMEKDLG